MEPECGVSSADEWAGLWVVVKDGNVIAAAPALRKLEDVRAGKGPITYPDPGPTDQIIARGG
jgi:hypothetical protein